MNQRYRSPEMDAIWGSRNRNLLERQLWIRVMRAQQRLGLDITDHQIGDYEKAMVDLGDDHDSDQEAIRQLEQQTGHDLYARLQVFNQRAGHQKAHLGLTSADVVENVQQLQILAAAEQIQLHGEQVLRRLGHLVDNGADQLTVGRTHGKPAQLTTIGKRAADWMSELLHAMAAVERAMGSYELRGIRGAVGTNTDMAQLLGPLDPRVGEPDGWAVHSVYEAGHAAATALDWDVWRLPELPTHQPVLSCGQIYPRSADLAWSSALLQVVAACTTVAVNVRLMSMLDIAQETPWPDQVGSSAMPHKTNPRYSERVHSLAVIARGYQHMLADLAGSQWFEGDVSSSAARRVALPGLFHAVDSCLANTAYVLDRLQFHQAQNAAQVTAWNPFMASGRLLGAFVQAGMVRSRAHELLRLHAQRALTTKTGDVGGEFVRALSQDGDCPLQLAEILGLLDLGQQLQWERWGASQAALLLVESVRDDLNDFDVDWPGRMM
jgi:adenylosuccinate lyase